MSNADVLLYGAHLAFWASFGLTRILVRFPEFLRHPIYAALNLLALGSAFWVPTAAVWAAFILVVIGSDLRAR